MILTIVLIALSSIFFRYFAMLVVRKKTPSLAMLQEHMPLLIIIFLVVFLYKGLDYSHAPFALDYLIAGIIAIFIRFILKNAVLAIIISTGSFMIMHDSLFKGMF